MHAARTFQLSEAALEPEQLKRSLLDRRSGALATFEGWVRNHNEGQAVDRLEYSSYPALAGKEGQAIMDEAARKFEIQAALALHRVGTLEIGEIAVWVGACAAHRSAAFDACRYIIEEIKARVPIWKKEHYSSGLRSWVNCRQGSQ